MALSRLKGTYQTTDLIEIDSALNVFLPFAFPLNRFEKGDALFYTTQWGYASKSFGEQTVSGMSEVDLYYERPDMRQWSPFEKQDRGRLIVTPRKLKEARLICLGYSEENRRDGDKVFANYGDLVKGAMKLLKRINIKKEKEELEEPLLPVGHRAKFGYELAFNNQFIEIYLKWLRCSNGAQRLF